MTQITLPVRLKPDTTTSDTTPPTGTPKKIPFDNGKLKISLKRTARVPDVQGEAPSKLPPDLGNFPLFPVRQFMAFPLGAGATVEGQTTGHEQLGGLQIELMPVLGFEIKVKILTGRIRSLMVTLEMMVQEVKALMTRKDGIPAYQQRFIFEGKQLEDGRSMEDYGIEPDSTLDLVLGLRGGGYGPPPQRPHEMGLGAGGEIKQYIQSTNLKWDPHAVTNQVPWVPTDVQILNSETFHQVTGQPPLKSPMSMKEYAKAGGKFFEFSEQPSGVHGNFGELAEGGEDEAEWQEGFEDWERFKSLA